MTLYRDPKVKFGGLEVGGIRISHMSEIEAPREMALQASKGAKRAYKVLPLKPAQKSAAAPVNSGPQWDVSPSDPAEWRNWIKAKLDAARTADDVAALKRRPDVAAAFKSAPAQIQAELNAWFHEAYQRVAYVPGADVDQDDAAAAA
jgi:hypothetical protein